MGNLLISSLSKGRCEAVVLARVLQKLNPMRRRRLKAADLHLDGGGGVKVQVDEVGWLNALLSQAC